MKWYGLKLMNQEGTDGEFIMMLSDKYRALTFDDFDGHDVPLPIGKYEVHEVKIEEVKMIEKSEIEPDPEEEWSGDEFDFSEYDGIDDIDDDGEFEYDKEHGTIRDCSTGMEYIL